MIGLDTDLADLGFSLPDALKPYADVATDAAKKTLAPAQDQLIRQYEGEVRKYDPWLEQQGRLAVRKAAAKIAPLLSPAPSKPSPPPSGPTWAERLYQPVLTPLLRGAEAEAAVLARPVLVKVALGLAGATVLAVLVGRWTKRCG